MQLITFIGIILIVGYFFGLIAEKLTFPRVTFYLFAGILFSKEGLGQFISMDISAWSDTFSQICLGFIAYIVGGEIQLHKIKEHGKMITLSTLFSSLVPVLFVYILFIVAANFLNIPRELAIVLAAISSTTAPAATVAVIEQYRAKGELTDTTLGIVILDDALGIFLFILMSSLFFPNGEGNVYLHFLRELVYSVGLGSLLGFGLSKFAKLSPSNDYLFPLLVGLVLLSVGLGDIYHFSSLLTCITLGIIANNTNREETPMSMLLPIEHIKELFFIIFFVFSGSQFSFSYFINGIEFIVIYVLARGMGKYIGAFIGSKLGRTSNERTPLLLGLTLLPQAGITLGLLIQVIHIPKFQPYKELLFNIILGSTIIYAFIGPILAKYALMKAGDIKT